MFGRQNQGNSSSGSNLVEFRAGRMNLIGKMVHPDTRKGLVYLTQSEDGLMHFCWKDRTSGKVKTSSSTSLSFRSKYVYVDSLVIYHILYLLAKGGG